MRMRCKTRRGHASSARAVGSKCAPRRLPSAKKYVKCSRCAFEYCWLCRKRWENSHAVVDCRPHGLQDWERELLKKGLMARTKREREHRLSQIKALMSRECTARGCGLLVARAGDGKMETCTTCGTLFCWICLSISTPSMRHSSVKCSLSLGPFEQEARLKREKAQLKAAQERPDLDDLQVETLI